MPLVRFSLLILGCEAAFYGIENYLVSRPGLEPGTL